AVSGYFEVAQRVFDVVCGAMAQALPKLTPAPSFGTIGVTTVSGRHPITGSYYVLVLPCAGGYGGSHGSDGLVHGTPPPSMASFPSIEMIEHRYPVIFDHFAIRED